MNKIQNSEKRKKDERIRELELENSLLKQKLEMINSIIGMNEAKNQEKVKKSETDNLKGDNITDHLKR